MMEVQVFQMPAETQYVLLLRSLLLILVTKPCNPYDRDVSVGWWSLVYGFTVSPFSFCCIYLHFGYLLSSSIDPF